MQEQAAAKLVLVMAGVVVIAAGLISATDVRPYGERDLRAQIAREDQALCTKLGATMADDCLRDLADLRERHVDLLRSHSWL
jgi:hypothetical protein